MYRSRARCREADSKSARVLRVAARHERRRLFVTDLNESDLVLAFAQRLHDSVDSVARKAKNDGHPPFDETVDQALGDGSGLGCHELRVRKSVKTTGIQALLSSKTVAQRARLLLLLRAGLLFDPEAMPEDELTAEPAGVE